MYPIDEANAASVIGPQSFACKIYTTAQEVVLIDFLQWHQGMWGVRSADRGTTLNIKLCTPYGDSPVAMVRPLVCGEA